MDTNLSSILERDVKGETNAVGRFVNFGCEFC